MTLGQTPRQADLFRSTAGLCEGRVAPGSIYGLLHGECHRLFPDEMFADLFTDVGRRSVPPVIVAVVMVLQRIEGCSDREAVDRFCFDARWKYAAGGLDFDYPGFVHTVLVDMRARLAASQAPNRIFDTVLEVAKSAGLVGRRRVLDSTPLYDAVATMDTVTLIRSAIWGLLKVADNDRECELRAVLTRDDDYAAAGKPVCDYDDPQARNALVDVLARDGGALLAVLDGRVLCEPVAQAMALLATVLGQDLEQDEVGVLRIARRVARDRVISTVDSQARHGRKTVAHGFDGYKGHLGIDPDSEIITATTVSPGNAGDASVAEDLISDLLDEPTADIEQADIEAADAQTSQVDGVGNDMTVRTARVSTATTPTAPGRCTTVSSRTGSSRSARPSSRLTPVGCSPRTASTSTWRTTPSPARPGTARRRGGRCRRMARRQRPGPPPAGAVPPTRPCWLACERWVGQDLTAGVSTERYDEIGEMANAPNYAVASIARHAHRDEHLMSDGFSPVSNLRSSSRWSLRTHSFGRCERGRIKASSLLGRPHIDGFVPRVRGEGAARPHRPHLRGSGALCKLGDGAGGDPKRIRKLLTGFTGMVRWTRTSSSARWRAVWPDGGAIR
ncbi:MAG: transposase [Pseudonocardiaceae bacterium]